MSKKTKSSEAASLAALLASDPAVEAKVEREIQLSTVVSHLLALRVGKGLTQDQVAERMGCDASKISRLESGTDEGLKWMDIVGYSSAVGTDIRLDHLAHLAGRPGCAFRQCPDFIGHNGKSPSLFAGTGCFYCSIKGEEQKYEQFQVG